MRKDVGVGSGVKGVTVLFTKKLRMDAELLKKLSVTDYSLLVGIHHVKRGNKDNVRSNTLKVFSVRLYIYRVLCSFSDLFDLPYSPKYP